MEKYNDYKANKKQIEEKTKSAKILVKEFLGREIEINNLQIRTKRYSMNANIPDESILTAIQKEYPNIGLGNGKKYFNIDNWILIKSKTIDLDDNIAVLVNRLYHYYDFLLSYEGSAADVVNVKHENFNAYETDYNNLIKLL